MGSLPSADAWRATAAEGIATFTFVTLGMGAAGAALTVGNGLDATAIIAIAAGHGLGIGLGVAAVGRISGAHMNPAVTLSAVFTGNTGVVRGAMYILAQLAGALVASLLLRWLFDINDLGVHTINSAVLPGVGAGLVLEIVLTFFLVFTVFALAIDRRGNPSVAPLAIGGVILLGHLVAIPLTGASMNPARSFGPAAVWGAWDDHWVYWIGPIVGGLIAAGTYTWLFGDDEAKARARSISLGDPAS